MAQKVWSFELQKLKSAEFQMGDARILQGAYFWKFVYCMLDREETYSGFKSSWPMRAKEGLDVVHSCICGPLEVPNYNGNKYFIAFVDELSRMLWLFLIKAKSEVFDVFKNI